MDFLLMSTTPMVVANDRVVSDSGHPFSSTPGWRRVLSALVLFGASFGFVEAGVVVLAREYAGRPFRLSAVDWSVASIAGLILLAAFCWDYPNILAGGLPRPFHWSLFAFGEGLGLLGFLHAWGVHRHRPDQMV